MVRLKSYNCNNNCPISDQTWSVGVESILPVNYRCEWQFSMREKSREGGSRGGGGIMLSSSLLFTSKSSAMAIYNIDVDICIKYLQQSIDLSVPWKPCTLFSCDIRKMFMKTIGLLCEEVSLSLYILLSCKTFPSLKLIFTLGWKLGSCHSEALH